MCARSVSGPAPSSTSLRRAPDAAAAVDMALIRLAYAADLPGPEEALKRLQAGEAAGTPSVGPAAPGGGGGSMARTASGGGGAAMARMVAPAQDLGPSPNPQSFGEVLALIDQRRDIALKLDVERYVRPISFRPGAIEYEPAPGAPANLAQRLVGRLKEWTGLPWLIAQGGGGAESAWERQKREDREVRAELAQDPFVRAVMQTFPGTEIIGVRTLPQPETAAPLEDDDVDED